MTCLKHATKQTEECSETADKGYDECTATRDEGYRDCCDWWPCSMVCDAWVWISNVVCVAWTWVSNVVCVAWTVITTTICVLWDTVVTVMASIYGTLESILGWALSAIGAVVELIFSIPYVGAGLRRVVNLFTHAVWAIVGFADTVAGAIGIRPEKKLRICTVILRDNRGEPVSSVEYVKSMLQVAANVYKRDANIRLIPSAPFQYSSGFSDAAETVTDSWVTIDDGTSDDAVLDVPEDSGPDDFESEGSIYQLTASRCCFYGSWRRVLGYGAPVTCFVVRLISNGNATGKAGFGTDYIRVDGALKAPPADSPRTIGHEIIHLVGLGHTCIDDDPRNIMSTSECNPASTTPKNESDPTMNELQVNLLRASKYATYF